MIHTLGLIGLVLLLGAASVRPLLGPSRSAVQTPSLLKAVAVRTVWLVAIGLVLAIGFGMPSLSSHAMNEAGLLPIVASVAHWLVALAWAGAVAHLTLLPWPQLIGADANRQHRITAFMRRCTTWSLIALTMLALTGGLLGFIHVHNADAMNHTAYGIAFKIKVVLFTALVAAVAAQRVRILPACRDAETTQAVEHALARFKRTNLIQALLLVGLLATTGNLATGYAPGVAPFLNPQTWHVADAEIPLSIALQPVAGQVSRARIEITAVDESYRFADGTIAVASVIETAQRANRQDIEALPIGPAAFLGEAVFATPGDWRIELQFEFPDGRLLRADHDFTLPGPPLEKDLRASLNVATIVYSRATLITFGVGSLLLLVSLWTIRLCNRERAPAWLMTAAFINGIFGGFLVLSVMFVKTYPSSFWPNPQPFTFDVVQAGEAIYRERCADCHGVTGSGDGPWALAGPGKLPDLSSPHMDTHTDGEIFWWNKYGIPSLGMPALGDELDDDDNWKVINFLRSLRHDFAPE